MSANPEIEKQSVETVRLQGESRSLDLHGQSAVIFLGPERSERSRLVVERTDRYGNPQGSEFAVAHVTADGLPDGLALLGGQLDSQLTLGRNAENNPMAMSFDQAVDPSHVTFEVADGDIIVTDHSTQGTTLQLRPL